MSYARILRTQALFYHNLRTCQAFYLFFLIQASGSASACPGCQENAGEVHAEYSSVFHQ